jgi:DNA-directed RNA polymerase subunit RPC12/RpoP
MDIEEMIKETGFENPYICLDCEKIFEESEIAEWEEPREFWGATVFETMKGCPYCHGDFVSYKEWLEEWK